MTKRKPSKPQKPQVPPLSYKPGPERQARITAYMEATGLNRSGAFHVLLDDALGRAGFPKPEPAEPETVAAPSRWLS